MKKIFLTFLFVLLFAGVAHASETVWFTPVPPQTVDNLKAGDDILLYASINNAAKDTITYTVAFSAVDKTIATKTVGISGYSAQSISVPWKMPRDEVVVRAAITKAIDKNKKEIASLKGEIGTVAVTKVVTPELPKLDGIKGVLGTWLAKVETWRVAQADHYGALVKQAKGELGQTTVQDITNYLQPDPPVQQTEQQYASKESDEHAKNSVQLIYASALQSFFAHKAFFYIASILIIFMVLRFIFGRFF